MSRLARALNFFLRTSKTSTDGETSGLTVIIISVLLTKCNRCMARKKLGNYDMKKGLQTLPDPVLKSEPTGLAVKHSDWNDDPPRYISLILPKCPKILKCIMMIF